MAHVVLTAVVGTVLNQLTTPALQEVLLLYNCRKELRRLEDTTKSIDDVLKDAEERQSKEHLVLGWLNRLKGVMYDADDLIDQVVLRALQKEAMAGTSFIKEVRLFLSESNHMAFIFRTAHRVKEIRKSLDYVTEDMRSLNFIPHRHEDARNERVHGDETYSIVREDVVFGRDKERIDIISLLLPQVERGSSSRDIVAGLSVIAIVGFGGLGKTTLAQYVYNDEEVKSRFDLRLWVCINYLSNIKQVLKAIIASSGQEPTDLGFEQLRHQLTEIISGKKLLLVIDNVWEEVRSNWLDLKTTLDGCNNGSRILVTTRSRVVAESLEALAPYYELQSLSEESAWLLFTKMAFTDGELAREPDLEPLGRQIVRKCGCVPLALIIIGSLLRRKEKRWWLRYVDRELPEVVRYNENRMAQALKISYDDLPVKLKLCFAYCSLFPKDYLFQKDKLAQLWLAQGFIEIDSKYGDEGQNSFLCLLERCFFQELQVDNNHGARRYLCKMHDLLHDLAREVAGKEYIVIEEVSRALRGTIRHMAFDCELDSLVDYARIFASSKGLRTLICSSKALGAYSLSKSFRMLRALDLSCTELVKISKSIGELIHMRYLNLSDNEKLISLPSSICKLLYLQTLNLSWCKSLVKLPSNIRQLTSLSCLLLNGCINLTYLPPGISALTLLESLDRLMVHQKHGGLSYLGRLDKLCGSLTIELPVKKWKNAVEDANKSNFFKKKELDGLVLAWGRSEISSDQKLSKDEVEQVLEAVKPHENLQYLKITDCGAGKLPTWVSSHQNIKELNLECWHEMKYMEDSITSSPFFRTLEILSIDDMDNLEGWWGEVAANEDDQATTVPCFPRVTKVAISRCPNLRQRMPSFSQIEELTLGQVDREAVRELLSVSMKNSNRLMKLKLERIERLEYLPGVWIGHLTTLKKLEVTFCNELRWVSRSGLEHLTALEELTFEECGKVELTDEYGEMEDDEGLPWEALQQLRVLKLSIWEMHFAFGVQHLTKLEDLAIYSWQQQEDEEEEQEEEEEEEEEEIREIHFANEAQNLTQLEDLGIIDWQLCQFGEDDYDYEEETGGGEGAEEEKEKEKEAQAEGEGGRVEMEGAEAEAEAGREGEGGGGVEMEGAEVEAKVGREDEGGKESKAEGGGRVKMGEAEARREGEGGEEAKAEEEAGREGEGGEEAEARREGEGEEEAEAGEGGGEQPCSWRHLTRLRKLTLGFDRKPCRFPEDIQHLRTLEHLVITDCSRLSGIWTAIAKLRQLQSLALCRVANVIHDDFTGPPHNLTSLKFDECHGGLEWMNHVPWDCLPSLRSLALVDMPDLEFLPQGIQNLNSIQQLTIMSCQNLSSLPDWMNKLISLRSFVIAICSDELKERCAEQTTADQLKHIPYFRIW